MDNVPYRGILVEEMNKFLPGQYCWLTIKSEDTSPIEVIGQVIDMDHDGERYYVYYDGMYFVRWANELQHIGGDGEEYGKTKI